MFCFELVALNVAQADLELLGPSHPLATDYRCVHKCPTLVDFQVNISVLVFNLWSTVYVI